MAGSLVRGVMLAALPALLPQAVRADAAPVEIAGGAVDVSTGDLRTRQGASGETLYRFTGRNATGQRIKDFELELRGCGPDAKFHWIKVYARSTFLDDGTPIEMKGNQDWDVDDDLSGLSDQYMKPDSTPPYREHNEADNVDDTPDTRARVDANGEGSTPCCAQGAAVAEDNSKRSVEDPAENKPGDEGRSGANQASGDLSGHGGIQPADGFVIELDLTAAPAGPDCRLVISPSGDRGRPIAATDRRSGFLPGACPEGQEGGLLAGTLNGLLGTDLAATCGDASVTQGGSHRYNSNRGSGSGSGHGGSDGGHGSD